MREISRTAIWDITSKCNLRCAHCYNQERYWENADKYSELDEKTIVSIIDKLVLLNFTRLHLLGGEPLLAHNFRMIVEYGKKRGLDVTLVTNGTLLTGEIAEFICNSGVSLVSISMDGTSAADNDAIRGDKVFEKVCTNIAEFNVLRKNKESEIRLVISFTLTARNIDNSRNIISFAIENDIDEVNVSYLSEEGEARKNYEGLAIDEYEKIKYLDAIIDDYLNHDENVGIHIDARRWLEKYLYKKFGILTEGDSFGCRGGDEQFYILADGTILPCSPSGTSMGSFLKDILPDRRGFPNVINDKAECIENDKNLIAFYNYTHDDATYKDIYPCNQCEYTCRACPLLHHNNKIVQECIVAKKLCDELDRENLDSVFYKSEEIRISTRADGVDVLTFCHQNHYSFSGIAKEIWEKIDGLNKYKEIIKEIYLPFSGQISYDEFVKDSLDFLYELKSLKLVKEKKNDSQSN